MIFPPRTASDRRGPRTLEALYARHAEGEAGDDQAWFMIYTTAGWQPVGFTGLRDIDYGARSALFAITMARTATLATGPRRHG